MAIIPQCSSSIGFERWAEISSSAPPIVELFAEKVLACGGLSGFSEFIIISSLVTFIKKPSVSNPKADTIKRRSFLMLLPTPRQAVSVAESNRTTVIEQSLLITFFILHSHRIAAENRAGMHILPRGAPEGILKRPFIGAVKRSRGADPEGRKLQNMNKHKRKACNIAV